MMNFMARQKINTMHGLLWFWIFYKTSLVLVANLQRSLAAAQLSKLLVFLLLLLNLRAL